MEGATKSLLKNQIIMSVKINITQDGSPESPREWDNLGTIAIAHRRYSFGDEEISEPHEWLEDATGVVSNIYDLEELEERFLKDYLALDVFMYEHGGISINTEGFSCPWDSGKVGYIYVSKDQLRNEYGWKRITKSRREKVEGWLRSEVKTLDQYLRGEVYNFSIEDDNGETIESCGGFFGDPHSNESGMRDYIPNEYLEQFEETEINY